MSNLKNRVVGILVLVLSFGLGLLAARYAYTPYCVVYGISSAVTCFLAMVALFGGVEL